MTNGWDCEKFGVGKGRNLKLSSPCEPHICTYILYISHIGALFRLRLYDCSLSILYHQCTRCTTLYECFWEAKIMMMNDDYQVHHSPCIFFACSRTVHHPVAIWRGFCVSQKIHTSYNTTLLRTLCICVQKKRIHNCQTLSKWKRIQQAMNKLVPPMTNTNIFCLCCCWGIKSLHSDVYLYIAVMCFNLVLFDLPFWSYHTVSLFWP